MSKQKKRDKNIKFVSANKDKVPTKINNETTQQSVPIIAVHEQYKLIETYPNCFIKLYKLGDNNYMTAPDEEQEAMFMSWRSVLNSFDSSMEFAITINNRTMNEDDIKESVLLKETGDNYDHLRKQMNKIILDRVMEGKNSLQKDKYLTVAVHAEKASKANNVFSRLDVTLNQVLGKLGSSATPISVEDTLEVLYGIYNDPSERFIQRTKVFDDSGKIIFTSSFDFDNMREMGLTINDLIGPTSIQILNNKMRFGSKWLRALQVTNMPSQMVDNFISNVTDVNFNCLTTINYKAMTSDEADSIINRNLNLVRDEKVRQMKLGQKNGVYDDSYISPDILDREAEALALRDDMHANDEKLFKTNITVVVFADTEEKLEQYTDAVITAYKSQSAQLSVANNLQEEIFNSTLPLCYNQTPTKRTLKSSSAAIMLPFDIRELNHSGGINYSCNLISKNLIVYDRLQSDNFNGFILGTTGSGKSFSAKVEMLNVFLKSNADIVVIDPDDEYTPLAKMLGGEVIKISPGGKNHINPLEIVPVDDLEEDVSPINVKADFILRLCECILKSPFGINSVQETIIDECVHMLYDKFMVNGELGYIEPDQMPTLTDLQKLFAARKEPEARELAMALKLYSGNQSLNVFGSRTNVNTSNRFIVYQIKNVGDRLTNLAMLIILDHIWNQIVENRKIGKATWFYADEIHLLFQNEYSASFLNTLFRRARKYMGVPTGITQNLTPLLESPTARDMLQNCCFIEILAQAGPDRMMLKEILNLSDTQLDYITSSPKGQGLLYTGSSNGTTNGSSAGSSVVPFYSVFPRDNDCYKVLTSDLREIKQIEMEKKREEARLHKGDL